MLLKIIAQSNTEDDSDVTVVETINDILRVGDRQFVYPNILWNAGSTFMVGDKPNTGFANQIIAIQYNHNFGWLDFTDVGNGTDTFDSFNHPVPFVHIENDYVYCGQTNTHNDPIDLFKFDVQNNIQNGYTELTQIGGENAYPQLFTDKDGRAVFCVRQYPEGVGDFNLSINRSDAGIEGTFTITLITQNTTGYRHYNCSPVLYGIQTKHYLLTNFRNNNNAEYFMHSIYVTDDWETYSNYAETFSKDVVNTATITMSENTANYVFNGSTANDTTNLNPATAIQVNDTLYVIYKDDTTEIYQIGKVEDGVFTNEVLDIDNLDHTQFYSPMMWWNGTNIVVSAICNNGGTMTKELWGVSTDFQTHTRKYTYSDAVATTRPILLPDNLDVINGQYMMVVDNDSNEATFVLTIDKFRL